MPRNFETTPVKMPTKKVSYDKVPILIFKIADIGKVLGYILEPYHPFYNTILAWQTKQAKKKYQHFTKKIHKKDIVCVVCSIFQ